MQKAITFNGHTFEYMEDLNGYECRGNRYYDDYHDQVPEPSLQIAADMLESYLTASGTECSVEWGEKGWIEVMIETK